MENDQGLSQYEIKGSLGKGNFGIVYKALNKKDKKHYALKEIFDFDKNTIDKVKTLSNINHDNIIKYYGSFIHKDELLKQEKLYIIMEYCENGDLRKFINDYKNKKEKICENEIILIIFGICKGLEEIHSKNIIHRDLKPENIFLNKDFKIKIGDFGISKKFEESNQYAHSQIGTIHYMAPEMIKEKDSKYNNKVDIWALGCIIYELCTLNYCFDANIIGIINQITNNEHGKINLNYYSNDLQNLIDLLLNVDYKKRPNIKDLYNRIKILKNEITMIIEIKDEDVNKDIYFLDNYTHPLYISKNEEGLKELNEENVELYIDDEKVRYKKNSKFSKGIHKIILKLKIKIKDCSKMFFGCENLTNIDLSYFNTSNVTNMNSMFKFCSNLISIDLSTFDTSNVNDMKGMFSNCRNLKNIDLSHFNTSKVTDMCSMFSNCQSFTAIDLSSFDTSNVTDMVGMFGGCSNIININISSFNTSKLTKMASMFSYCLKLANINLSSFNTSNVKDMRSLFEYCNGLTNLDLSYFNTSKVVNMGRMFFFCQNLTNLNLSSFNTSKVTNMNYMFYYCNNLISLDLSSFNISNIENISKIFSKCFHLTNINSNDSKLVNALNDKYN